MRYKWGYTSCKKDARIMVDNQKLYHVRFSNLEAETEDGSPRPSLHTGYDELYVMIATNTPTKTLRAACSEFRDKLELLDFVEALHIDLAGNVTKRVF